MRKKFVCKIMIKNALMALLLVSIFFLIALLFVSFYNHFAFPTKAFFAFGFFYLICLIYTLIYILKFSARLLFLEDKIILYYLGKRYSLNINKIYIIYMQYEFTSRQTNKKIYSIKIRPKGQKEFIPIRIMDSDIIKQLLSVLDYRREPQDFKFEWEQKD